MQEEYKGALRGETDLDKKIDALGNLNELAYEGLILLIDASFALEMVAYALVQNANGFKISKDKCKLAWGMLINNSEYQTALSLLKLKTEFHNSKLENGRASNSINRIWFKR